MPYQTTSATRVIFNRLLRDGNAYFHTYNVLFTIHWLLIISRYYKLHHVCFTVVLERKLRNFQLYAHKHRVENCLSDPS